MWKLELTAEAERHLERLAESVLDRVDAALVRLSQDPELGKALVGDWAGCRSYRIGHYRIVYRVDADVPTVYVLTVAERARAYQRRR